MSRMNPQYDEFSLLGKLESETPLVHRELLGFDIKISRSKSSWRLQKRRRVAVIVLHEGDTWGRRAAKGLLSSICNGLSPEPFPEFDVFSADANTNVLRDQVLPAIEKRQDEYAFIATIGSWVSKQVHVLAKEQKITTPRLFVGVHDPVESGLVPTLEYGHEGVVGVKEPVRDFGYQLSLLKVLRPELKTILLPFDPAFCYDGFDADRKRLHHHAKELGVAIKEVAILLHGDVATQLKRHLDGVDIVWIFGDPATRLNTKKLVSLCKKEAITLLSADLASLFQGAALGFGDSGSRVGACAGQLGFALLTGQRKPEELPVVTAQHPKVLRVNPAVYEEQGIELGKAQRSLLQEVIPLGWE